MRFWTKLKSDYGIEILVVLLITFLAGFLRFYLLGEIPCGLFPDQALNGLDALRLTQGMFSPVYNGKEALFIILVAAVQSLFGVGLWQVFFASALVGTLTVPALYLLGKELFNRKVAFFSSLFLAVSGWHVALSRNGFRAILVPLVIILFAFFLLKALKAKRRRDKIIAYVLTSVTFVLGFYTYNAYVIFGVLVFVIGVCELWNYRKKALKNIKKNKKAYFWALLSSGVVLAPLAAFILLYPQEYFGRAGSVNVFATNIIVDSIKVILENFWDSFRGIFTDGDNNWRHNPSGMSLLVPGVSGMFLLGLLSLLKSRGRLLYILLGFLVMFLPGILTVEGSMPHSLRLIGILPFVFLIAGIGAGRLWTFIITYTWVNRFIWLGSMTMMVIVITALGSVVYFDARDSVHYYMDFRCDLTSVHKIITPNTQDYIVVTDDFTLQTLRYLNYPNKINYLKPEELLLEGTELDFSKHYVLTNSFGEFDEDVIMYLDNDFTQRVIKNRFGEIDYYLFEHF